MPAKPSPFPGMDPYMERSWEDVHPTLIGYIKGVLAPQLPDDLTARIEERVYIDLGGSYAPFRKPDVRVVEQPTWGEPGGGMATATGVATRPVLIDWDAEPVTEGYIQIVDAKGDRIVTAIEVVSPANKVAGAGRTAYLRKRDEFIAGDTNLVEIDLVRAGEWITMMTAYLVPATYHTTYRVSVRRSIPHSKGELYPITLADRLPTIAVPLRSGEPDALVDLQGLVARAYAEGRYDRTDYARPCDPPLTGAEADWADALLRAAGRR